MQSCGFASLVQLSSVAKMSFIVGSCAAWFSASAIMAPLAGFFGGIIGCGVVLIVRMVFHYIIFKTISFKFLALCIPGFCASLYWATRSSIIRVVLPLACMALFIAHPVGNQAFFYSFYWFIPVVLFFVGRETLFMQALGSTFVAHAVGSVIWLYTVPMTAVTWMALIPVVALERFVFAMGMVVVCKSFMVLKNSNCGTLLRLRAARTNA